MPKIEENLRQQYPAIDLKVDFLELKEVTHHRELYPFEKLWIETAIFNELFVRLSTLSNDINEVMVREIFKGNLQEAQIQAIINICTKFSKGIQIGITNPKLLKAFRLLAVLQGFENMCSKSYLDNIYKTKISSGDKFQYEKFRTHFKVLNSYMLSASTISPLDSLDVAELHLLLHIVLWLRDSRGEGQITW